jgi:hypothetical protein
VSGVDEGLAKRGTVSITVREKNSLAERRRGLVRDPRTEFCPAPGERLGKCCGGWVVVVCLIVRVQFALVKR